MDELIAAVREYATEHPVRSVDNLPRCVMETELQSVEQDFGCRFPSLFRRLYLEVADGSFGPGYGLLRINPDGKHWEDSVIEFLNCVAVTDENDPDWRWPVSFLPLCSWGCATFSVIDANDDAAPVYAYDPNSRFPNEPSENAFALSRDSLEEWLCDWMDGENLWDAMFEDVGPAREGVNPFTGKGVKLPPPRRLRRRT